MEVNAIGPEFVPRPDASTVARAPAPAPAAASEKPSVPETRAEDHTEQLTADRVRPAIENLRARFEANRASGIRLRVDEATDRVIAQILNESNETIKQIPPEELLEVYARFRAITGLLFDLDI